MVMLTLVDFVLAKFGGDSLAETRDNVDRYRERLSHPVAAPGWSGRPGQEAAEVASGGDD
jgi:hypothetical protein